MKFFYLVGAIVLSVYFVAAQEDSIRNFLRVNDEFCTGGQPSLQHLEKLKADGVKAIINLRQPNEYAAAEEEAKAKVLGLRYFNIPVSPTDPKDEQATEFLKITDNPENRPAFIHCRSAARVAAFWMIRRVLRDGWKIEDAVKEAEKIGLGDHPPLSEFAHKYIERHRQSPGAPGPVAAPVESARRCWYLRTSGSCEEISHCGRHSAITMPALIQMHIPQRPCE